MSPTFLFFVISLSIVSARDLKFFVTGDGYNIGETYILTEPTAPVYTPGQADSIFSTTLETNFTNGLGRFIGYRDVAVQAAGPGDQVLGGYADIKGNLTTLGAAGAFRSIGDSFSSAGTLNLGANGTVGASFVNITNDNVVYTGLDPTQPQGSFVQNSFSAGSIRSGAGLTRASGFSLADSITYDSTKPSFASTNSIGRAASQIVGNDTISFANGDSFAVSGSNEAVTGCGQDSGAAAYGVDGGNDGYSVAACSSKGAFLG